MARAGAEQLAPEDNGTLLQMVESMPMGQPAAILGG
jgi:hypothetical protein